MTAIPLPNPYLPDSGKTISDLALQTQANFDALSIATGTSKVVRGVGTLTIPNTFLGDYETIPHTMGQVPTTIVCTGGTAPFGSYYGTVLTVISATATDFTLWGFNLNSYTGGVVVNVHYILAA